MKYIFSVWIKKTIKMRENSSFFIVDLQCFLEKKLKYKSLFSISISCYSQETYTKFYVLFICHNIVRHRILYILEVEVYFQKIYYFSNRCEIFFFSDTSHVLHKIIYDFRTLSIILCEPSFRKLSKMTTFMFFSHFKERNLCCRS